MFVSDGSFRFSGQPQSPVPVDTKHHKDAGDIHVGRPVDPEHVHRCVGLARKD